MIKQVIPLLLLLLAGSMPARAQLPQVAEDHVQASLVAETESAVPGQSLWVAVRLQHDDNWHTYWKNPGDAGQPTTIDWSLPEGVTAGEIVWPTPRRFELPADLVDYGYEGEIFLLTELHVPGDIQQDILGLSAEVRWLECEAEICIPNGAEVSLDLPVDTSIPQPSIWAAGINATLAQQPRTGISLDSSFTLIDGAISLLVQATEPLFADIDRATYIPGEHRVFDYLSTPQINWQTSSLQLTQGHHRRLAENLPEVITGLLIVEEGDSRTVYEINAAAQDIDLSQLEGIETGMVVPELSLLMVFVFAVTGGLILNLMPCVLPVLSLKVISVIESAGTSRHEQKMHALVYTAGVIASFLVLAVILLGLQASGEAIGWGFHMQSPVFVSVVAGLFLIMGLSMSGFLEIGTGMMGIGSNLSLQSGYRGSFFTGVLTCLVASPCTMPFMGPALAVAFTQPALISLTIFASLGLGVALPFLLIAYIPALAHLMPKPGQWMLTFKHVMAIPLYGALVWMLWVLQRQTGSAGMLGVLGITALLAVGLWMNQRGRLTGAVTFMRSAGRVAVAGSLVLAVAITQTSLLDARTLDEDYGFAEPFSEARLAELRAAGEPVFVNMTASWCIPCLVNEKVALGSAVFEQALADKGVTYLKGDWTNNDPEITAVLKRYNTSGVPLYLMFPSGTGGEAEVLPPVLTEGILLNALDRI